MATKPIGIDDAGNLPARARTKLATNLADDSTPEGSALTAKFAAYGGLSGTFRPRAVYNRLGAIEKGVATQLRWCLLGTSVAYMKWYEYANDLARAAGGYAGAILITGGSNTRSPRSGPGLTMSTTGTVTLPSSNNGNDVAVWPGPTGIFQSGASRSYGNGGVNATYDRAEVYYIGSAGSFSVQVGANAPVTVDASLIPAGSLGVYTATVPSLAQQAFTVAQVSGAPKIIGAGLWNSTIAGMLPIGISAPGMTYSTLQPQAWANLAAFLEHVAPDMITWEAKAGQWIPDGQDITQLTKLLDTFVDSTPMSDVVLIGSTPDNGGAVPGGGSGVSQLAANLIADAVSRTYAPGLNVAAWDGYTPLGDWSALSAYDAAAAAAGTATAGDWAGDGVHLGWRSEAYLSALLLRDLGLESLARETVARKKLAATTQVNIGKTLDAPVLILEGDNSFDLDGYMRVKRALKLRSIGGNTDLFNLNPTTAGQSWISTDIRLGVANGPRIAAAPTLQTLTNQSGTVTLDLSVATKFVVNLVGNVTSWAFTNYGSGGQEIEVHFNQDATGGRTIPTSGAGAGGGAIKLRSGFTFGTAASQKTVVKLTQISGSYIQSAQEVII